MSESDELKEFLSENGGVVSVSDLAEFLQVDEQVVRRWARTHDVARVGPTFAFTLKTARKLEEYIDEDPDEDPDEDADEDPDEEADEDPDDEDPDEEGDD